VAIDSSGYEAGHTSTYYGQRCGLKKSRYPKFTAVCDVDSYLYLSAVANRGPYPDHREIIPAAAAAHKLQPFHIFLADAGYDSEPAHVFIREQLGAISIIPPTVGRPILQPDKLPSGYYRREMVLNFPKSIFGRRWHIETCTSMDKRRFGDEIKAKKFWSQCRGLYMIALVHNIAVLRRLYFPETARAMFSTEHERPYSFPLFFSYSFFKRR
jgi:hypothetical protein